MEQEHKLIVLPEILGQKPDEGRFVITTESRVEANLPFIADNVISWIYAEKIVARFNSHASDQAKIEALVRLLQRAKETFEPFPVCSDLRSMTQRLREKHPETEVQAIKKGFAEHEEKFRQLYRDIEAALSKEKQP